MNPNQPDPMSEEEITRIQEWASQFTGWLTLDRVRMGKLCATALRAISLERELASLRAKQQIDQEPVRPDDKRGRAAGGGDEGAAGGTV